MQIPRDYLFTKAELPKRLKELTREYIKYHGELKFNNISETVH
jgi:hypothetical protein